MHEARVLVGQPGVTFQDMYDALDGADALLIATEWKGLPRARLRPRQGLLKTPLIIDGRNLYTPADVRAWASITRASAAHEDPAAELRGLARRRAADAHCMRFPQGRPRGRTDVPPGAARWPSARRKGFRPRMPQRAGAAAFLAGAGRYDIIHAQTANTVTWAVLTKWLHRRRWPSRAAPPSWSSRTRNGRPASSGATSICSWPSARWPRRERRLGIEPAIIRSAVEPHAINADNVAALVSEFQLDGRKVMAIGRADPGQGPGHAGARAVAELARTRREHLSALRRRRPGFSRQDEARKLGIEDVYRFAGFRKGVEDFYSVLDVFVMSSEEEALGSSVLDAFLRACRWCPPTPAASGKPGRRRGVLRRGRPSRPGRRHGALPGRRRLPPGNRAAPTCAMSTMCRRWGTGIWRSSSGCWRDAAERCRRPASHRRGD